MEDQARRALHHLIDAIESGCEPETSLLSPGSCPNCGAPFDSPTSPYCSECCRDKAAFVRQFRAAISSRSILTPEKQLVFGERLWWLLGGGLPLRESRIPESAKRQVTKRSAGKCEACGASMTRVENIGSGCNRPLHLRAVCDSCSETKSYTDLEFIENPLVMKLLAEFAMRVSAEKPVRLCDDPERWDWRAFVKDRQNLFKNGQAR